MKRHGPDSLHSWLVTAGLTFLAMILYAVVRLSGLLFVASMDRFGVDRKSASLPYILTDFIQAISSPLTGFLAAKFGARLVMVLGCFVSGVGIASCFFAERIETVTVCWGVVLGVGFGLSVPLLALVITQHFVEKRAVAMGIMYFGGYAGFSLLPTPVEHLIAYYGLSGTFLLIAGLMFNCIPVALLLRRPKFSTIKNSTSLDESDLVWEDSDVSINDVSELSGVVDNAESATGCKGIVNYSLELESSIKKDYLNVTKRSGGEDSIENATDCKDIIEKSDVQFSNSPKLNNERRNNTPHNKLNTTQTNTSIPRAEENSQNNKKKDQSLGAFKVFLEPVYIVVLIAEAVFEGSLIAFITILVDFSLDVGLAHSDTKFVLLTFSIFSNVGVVSFGWVTDGGHLSLTTFSGMLLVLRCATSVFIAFSKSMPVLLTAVALQGLCEAPLSNLFPLIIAEHYAPEVHGVAISCRLFLCAPVYLVTPTLIGYFRDGLGSYFYLFLVISVGSFISGVLCYFIPQLSKCRCGREDDSMLRKKSVS